DKSPLEHAHLDGWVANYTPYVNESGMSPIQLRIRLRMRPGQAPNGLRMANPDWTHRVERSMLGTVKIPTYALVHFRPVHRAEYFVCSATGGCAEFYRSGKSVCGRSRQGRCPSVE